VIRTNSRRIAMGATALCFTGAVAVAATALSDSASAAGTEPTPGAAAQAAPAIAPLTAAQVRAETIRKYGVHPLPISERSIVKYKLSKKTLRDLVKARKLASTTKAKRIRKCESGGNYKSIDGSGYYGAYQFDRGTWLSNGGGKYGRTANKAPAWAQDLIMYKTYQARGWSPWTCQ
jgi:hypothetical protein